MHQSLLKRCSTSPLKNIVTHASRTRSPILCRLGASIRPAKLKERSTSTEDKGNHKNGSTAAGNSPPRWDQKVLISLQHCTLAFSIRVYLPHSSCRCLLRFIFDSRRSSSSSSEIGTAKNVHHIISSPLAMKSSGNCRARFTALKVLPRFHTLAVALLVSGSSGIMKRSTDKGA